METYRSCKQGQALWKKVSLQIGKGFNKYEPTLLTDTVQSRVDSQAKALQMGMHSTDRSQCSQIDTGPLTVMNSSLEQTLPADSEKVFPREISIGCTNG